MKFDDLYLKHLGLALIAAAALFAIPAFGAEANKQDASASNAESTTLALATTGQQAVASGAAGGSGTAYPPLEAGVHTSNLGRYVNGSAVQRWRHFITLNWNYGPWGGTLAQQFISGYTDGALNAAGQERRVGAYEKWDMQGAYDGVRNLKIAMGIKNLFNRAPPFTNQGDTFQIGQDPNYADPRGRLYYGRLTYSFK